MKQTRLIMGMPIQVEVRDANVNKKDFAKVFDYFRYVDETFSPFKKTSEVGKMQRGEEIAPEMKKILRMCGELKKKTKGYFDIRRPDGRIDPSGLVKGWAIKNAAELLKNVGYKRFYIDAGGDAEISGKSWKWGIRNPFNIYQIVKALELSDCGIATSGTYERGQHIYNPITRKTEIADVVSLTVIGHDVFEADKFATPAFAMGREGISFIESLRGIEGYMIDSAGVATMTSGFAKYEIH